MARDWIRRNRGQGNVLKMDAADVVSNNLPGGLGFVDANIYMIGVDLGAAGGDITLNINVALCIPGDIIVITATNDQNGEQTLILGVGFAPGQVTVTGTDSGPPGVLSLFLVFNGINYAATVTPVAIP